VGDAWGWFSPREEDREVVEGVSELGGHSAFRLMKPFASDAVVE
jgi:hypothetical protein